MNNKNNNKKNNKNKNYRAQRGLRIASLNVNGMVSNTNKRVELNAWLETHDIDILCGQEWFVPHQSHKKNNNNNNNNNSNSISDNDSDEELFENENKNDISIETQLDMAQFKNYEVITGNNKTFIMYKSQLDVIRFDHIPAIKENGLNATWLGVKTYKSVIVIASGYHSPSFSCSYNELVMQINRIDRELKASNNKKRIYMLNGDFNSKNELWGSTITDERGENLADWLVVQNLAFLNNGDYTHSRGKKREVLDIMSITNNAANMVKNWYTSTVPTNRITKLGEKKRFSDHKAMIAVLNTDPNIKVKPDKVTWNLDERKIKDFRKALKPLMQEWKSEYDKYKDNRDAVDMLVEYFQLLFVKAAKDSFGFKRYNHQSVNWVDNKIHHILVKKKKITNKISHLVKKMKKRYGSIMKSSKWEKRILRKLKKRKNKLQKKLKKQKYKNVLASTEKIEKLINDPKVNNEKMFYDLINKISQKKTNQIPPIRNPRNNEIIATTNEEISSELHRHFTRDLTRNKYEDKHIIFHNHVNNTMNNYKKNRLQSNSIVNRKYTEQEVLHVINNVNKLSAMAFDFIHYQLIIWSKFIILTNLTLLFNLCFYIHQKCPKVWKFGEYVPIPKPGRIPYYSKNIRPISILPGLGRIIGKLNCNRLLADCIKRRILSKNNCAFQCNRGTNDVVINAVERVYRAFQNGHYVDKVIKDLNSAYDSVWVNGMLYRMNTDYGYEGNIIAWYIEFLNGRKTRVKYNGVLTKWKLTRANLPQGSTDSTILFVLFLNNINLVDMDKILVDLGYMLEKEIDKYTDEELVDIESFRVDIVNFADDTTLSMEPIVTKCNLTDKIKYKFRLNMQKAINQFYNWTRYYQLIIKKAKCSTITFSRKNKFRAYVYKLDGEKLEIVHSYKNCPQICKHNARSQYCNANNILQDDNGDSDLENMDENGEKINVKMKQDGKMLQIRKTGNLAKLQKSAIVDLPLSVRMLGVHFDPELFLNEHINIVRKKVEKKLHCLLKLAFCKYYDFNPFVIYKLFETVIRPKMEYALCTVSQSIKFKELEKIQKRAMRIALRVKTQTPTKYLMELVNGKTLQEKLEEQQVKMWHKYFRAPNYLLQHDTFKKWKEYITTNDSNCLDKFGNIGIDGNIFNIVKKSPLSRAYSTVKQLYPEYRNIMNRKPDSVMRPPPVYYEQYPNNIFVNPGKKENQEIFYDFYTDGSCLPNPGPGGAGFYSSNFVITSKMHVLDHDTTINYCELYGIKMVVSSFLRYLNFCNNNGINKNGAEINIFTDSQFVCDIMSKNGYPKLEYYYNLLQSIFVLCNELNRNNIIINLIKIDAHKGIAGNTNADLLAKEAAIWARMSKYGEANVVKYNMNKNPVNVDIAKDLIKLRQKRRKERKKEWIFNKNNSEKSNMNNRFKGEGLLEKSIINDNYSVRNRSNFIKNELKYLKKQECEIIMKLRTEYINLNNYRLYIGKHNDGTCDGCNAIESVSHFLIECPGFTDKIMMSYHKNNRNYDGFRKKLRKNLRKIDVFFKYEENFNAVNLLFPHIWQIKPKKKDINYQEMLERNTRKRVSILKAIVKFTMETRRFCTDIKY